MHYHKRFQQSNQVKKIAIRGRFTFAYVGKGNIVYTFPGKDKPIIGKLDISEFISKKVVAGISFVIIVFLVFSIFFTRSGIATTTETSKEFIASQDDKKEEYDFKNLDPQEIEKKSEELKTRLLNEDNEIEKALKDKKVKFIHYTVKEGDNIHSIASKFRIPVKFILKENQLKKENYIYPGQELKIPNRPGIFYKIKKGDRLVQIAEKYQVSLDDIINDNDDLQNSDILEVGKKIFLPNAVIPEPPPVWHIPVNGKINSYFGYRLHPIYNYRQFHGGIDISAYYEVVRAARDGVVYYAGYMGGYGLAIVLKHGNDFKTLYAHLSKIKVRVGQVVKAGNIIGISGNTGFSTGAHLHFEIIYKGNPVNPLKYLKKKY